jgi:hypothetical protein
MTSAPNDAEILQEKFASLFESKDKMDSERLIHSLKGAAIALTHLGIVPDVLAQPEMQQMPTGEHPEPYYIHLFGGAMLYLRVMLSDGPNGSAKKDRRLTRAKLVFAKPGCPIIPVLAALRGAALVLQRGGYGIAILNADYDKMGLNDQEVSRLIDFQEDMRKMGLTSEEHEPAIEDLHSPTEEEGKALYEFILTNQRAIHGAYLMLAVRGASVILRELEPDVLDLEEQVPTPELRAFTAAMRSMNARIAWTDQEWRDYSDDFKVLNENLEPMPHVKSALLALEGAKAAFALLDTDDVVWAVQRICCGGTKRDKAPHEVTQLRYFIGAMAAMGWEPSWDVIVSHKSRLTQAEFARQAGFLAKNASSWGADALHPGHDLKKRLPRASVKRFLEEMRERLNIIEEMADGR